MIKLLKNLYIHPLFFYYISGLVVLFLLSFWFPMLYSLAWLMVWVLVTLFIVDVFLLFRFKKGFVARRKLTEKFSNSDANSIPITLENQYPFSTQVKVIDEIPVQFQKRDFEYTTAIKSNETHHFNYNLRPVERGEYYFGNLICYVSSPLHMVARRFRFDKRQMVAVYPSYIQMKKYEFLAMSKRLTEYGLKKYAG